MVTFPWFIGWPKFLKSRVSPRRKLIGICSKEETFGNHFGDGALRNMFFLCSFWRTKDLWYWVYSCKWAVSRSKGQKICDIGGEGWCIFRLCQRFSWWSDELVVHENWWTCFHSVICSMYDIFTYRHSFRFKLNCRYMFHAWSIFDWYLFYWIRFWLQKNGAWQLKRKSGKLNRYLIFLLRKGCNLWGEMLALLSLVSPW